MREDVGKARIRRHSEVGDDLVDVLDEFADAMRVNDSDGAVVSSAMKEMGHFFVFALMYLAVSLSLLFFSSHACSCAQLSG